MAKAVAILFRGLVHEFDGGWLIMDCQGNCFSGRMRMRG
jgi:hypothetical protein